MTETDYAVHPSEFLDEYLEDNEIDVRAFADHIGYSVDEVQKFLDKDTDLNMALALSLSESTNIPFNAWLKIDTLYQKDKERLGVVLVSVSNLSTFHYEDTMTVLG